ncbi:hypothetical protein [Ornithinimicrobium tianjinense]|uniref:Uncharacterized protein n=1 Tax=Ornithinimicrobium tianjinense TaxID=1195761 RepID=A0A917F7X3_9MICO|nr:hypothetical protein [Ornithinimicrobium tianjinense]GGF56633.1 hypothetical protein GCM10011366_25610 [Ornithinimicrobium tianjinense]
MSWHDEHEGSRGPTIDDDLRAALDGSSTDFDYDALIAGTKVRAARLRRRQTVARAVTAAVLAPTLAGAGWLLSSTLGQPDASTEYAAQPTDDVSATTGAAPTTDDVTTTTAPARVDGPPHQDPEELPDAVLEPVNPDWPNRWEMPDVRPTGVAFLDALGAPQSFALYPRTVPLMHFTTGEDGRPEPHSAASYYFFASGNEVYQDTVEITLTAWDDSAAPIAALRGGALSGTVVEWPGRTDDDHLLVEERFGQGWTFAGAAVRQGDYIVGVTVLAETAEEARAAATEIAEKSAANLAYLDPENATD